MRRFELISAPAVFIETYGCAFNIADGEALTGVLTRAGYRLATDATEADVIILNTCTVKDRTYLEFEKRFRALREAAAQGAGPRVILAGCIPKAYERSELLAGVPALGPDAIAHAAEVVRAALAGEAPHCLRVDGAGEINSNRETLAGRALLPTRRRNPFIEILPIARGCLSACTFCQTRLARGRLVSFRPGDIFEHARQAIAEGVRQIWLTAQDTGAYGQDGQYPLPRLLERICELEGDFRVRLGMSSPHWIQRDLPGYMEALAHPKMFKFLHIPVQSGSDRVLAAMRRGHTAAQFEEVCAAFHERFPEGALLTDIIVGYPTETEEDFVSTLALLERVRPAAVNRSRFSPRPGTVAAGLRPLPGDLTSARSHRLNELVHSLARDYHARWVGRRGRVLTAEQGHDATIAYNEVHRPVSVEGQWPLGQWLDIEYTSATDFHLLAQKVK